MNQFETTSISHCSVCGKMLRDRATSGPVNWLHCYVDDSGILCADCRVSKKTVEPEEYSASDIASLFTSNQDKPCVDTATGSGIV